MATNGPSEHLRPRGLAAGAVLAWVGHPGTVLAVAVMAVNDHLLKQALPGVVTGKLSDVAGLVLAPPLLALPVALICRTLPVGRAANVLAALSILVTGMAFSLVKCTAAGAALASELWSLVAGPSRVLADPSDLLALPALGAGWWLWTRARSRSAGTRIVRLARVWVAVPLTVVTVAATSASFVPEARAVVTWEGKVLLQREGRLLTTSDGGDSWRPLTDAESADLAAARTGRPVQRTEACVPGTPEHCYRVGLGGPRVEESVDGGRNWTVAWEITAGRQAFLRRAHQNVLFGPSPAEFASTSVVVVGKPGGHVVIVAEQQDGLVVRDTSGRWERRGFAGIGSSKPVVPLTGLGQYIFTEWVLAAMAGWICFLIGSTVTGRGRDRPRYWVTAAVRGTIGVAWPVLVLSMAGPFGDPGMAGRLLILITLPIALVVLNVGWPAPQMAPRGRAWLVAVSMATAGLVALPFLGWTVAEPDSYSIAARLAVALFLVGIAVSATVGWSVSRRRPDAA
ncbi:hypothetical protein ACFWVC_22285 [Streptomyces sp. NPDC058691]|uniref:hypothetical protein n=1 Tax=Streptomyces sp. NPDC058691 TaxID=3346601 RepID=UPI003651B74B